MSKILEPNDDFMMMSDEDLIKVASKLIKDAKKSKIEDYLKNNLKFRSFNLIGLVSNQKIECDSKRQKIREICRKCYEFLYNQPQSVIPIEPTITPDPIKNKFDFTSVIKVNPPNLNSPTCIHKFKRGEKRNELCNQPTVQGWSYCELCLNRNKIVENSHNKK